MDVLSEADIQRINDLKADEIRNDIAKAEQTKAYKDAIDSLHETLDIKKLMSNPGEALNDKREDVKAYEAQRLGDPNLVDKKYDKEITDKDFGEAATFAMGFVANGGNPVDSILNSFKNNVNKQNVQECMDRASKVREHEPEVGYQMGF